MNSGLKTCKAEKRCNYCSCRRCNLRARNLEFSPQQAITWSAFMPPATLLVSLVGNRLDPILSAVATSRKALYQRVPTVAALQQQLSSPAALERVVLIELSQLSIPGSSPRDTLRQITQWVPEMRIVVVASQAKTLFAADRKWLEVSPHVTVLSGIRPCGWHASGKPLFEALFGEGDFSTELRRVEPFIKALDPHAAATAIDLAQERKIDYVSAALSMVSPRGIVVGDRRYRLKLYPEVFVFRIGGCSGFCC
jgi:hypothetical protein